MIRALRIVASSLLITLAAAFPVLAAEPKFEHCSVTDPALPTGAAIIRTRAPGGRQIFQSSLPLPVMRDGDKRLRAYLVWPEGGSEEMPKLWILHEFLSQLGVVSHKAELRMQVAGAKKAVPTVMGRQLSRGDFEIFEIEIAALESQFSGAASLKMRIADVSDRPRLASRWEPREVLNLSALRVQIAAHRAAAQSQHCGATQIMVPHEVNANSYLDCTQSSAGELGFISVEAGRFWWQYPLGDRTYLNADRTIYVGEAEDAFFASIETPFRGPHGPLMFRTSLWEKGVSVPMTVVMTADTVRYEVQTKQGEAVLDREAVLRLDATDAPIRLVSTDQNGKIRLQTTLPANLFSRATVGLIEARRKLIEGQKNPMKSCAPEHSIVVT